MGPARDGLDTAYPSAILHEVMAAQDFHHCTRQWSSTSSNVNLFLNALPSNFCLLKI
jgi:hypothetical protein